MKYTSEVMINKKREEVIEIFDSRENTFKWQETLKTFDIIDGEKGVNGLKSKMVYDNKGKEMVMIETIEKFNFPDEMIARYEAKNVWNRCVNQFVEKGDQTLWIMETEFVCKGFMKIISTLGKGMFVKQTQADMVKFKQFAESI